MVKGRIRHKRYVRVKAEAKAVLVQFPKGVIEKLDSLVPHVYPNRNEAIRTAVMDLVKHEAKA